jgi:hypothetical protein
MISASKVIVVGYVNNVIFIIKLDKEVIPNLRHLNAGNVKSKIYFLLFLNY